jgi:negative regulator of genetic competence, sporulation and motility
MVGENIGGIAMEVLKINESKVKIVLDAIEAERYAIGTELGECDVCDARDRASIYAVLDEVRKKHGFDHRGERLLVQVYAAKGGGAEIFVTRIGAIGAAKSRAIAKDRDVGVIGTEGYLLRFDTKEALVACAASLASLGTVTSSLFSDRESGAFYLSVSLHTALDGKGECQMPLAVSELAISLPRELLPFIKEHFTATLTSGAVEWIAKRRDAL